MAVTDLCEEPGRTRDAHWSRVAIRHARALAERAHQGQVDRFGLPLAHHAIRVAAAVRPIVDDHGVVAALLHDTVEKTPTTFADLLANGIDPVAVELVDVLTEREGEPTEAYLERCARHPIARIIKRADLLDKLDPMLLASLPPEAAEATRTRIAARLATLSAYSRTANV